MVEAWSRRVSAKRASWRLDFRSRWWSSQTTGSVIGWPLLRELCKLDVRLDFEELLVVVLGRLRKVRQAEVLRHLSLGSSFMAVK